ncbi:immunoglobulin-like domain-containing protein [Xylocopilactobacillus apis]|uniref:Pesticidal crystal protein Cry22Aa Ig-like domain-containing protein n=1 Tax=Xylocopilactobacillus apis TaxID=2932183 RepID=A0AAU9D9N7_9LACO|nr:immunoglobulin-like domain-containing protein [Xylocopilactobacillus apis]BDR57527.1 hypothetical protein KIMC2_20890 [Xylocopilactobacillus apis]
MKFKIAGLASTALLLLSPVAGAMSAVANANTVHAVNNWDYDVDNPGVSSYDALLQNAGPVDGIVDWYPTKGALGENPSAQKLVKQLIDLSIATNDSSSNARKILFSDTTGSLNTIRPEYKDTYNNYELAFGFIAQILNMNNTKTGLGAKLEQNAEPSGEDGDTNRGKDDPVAIDGNLTKDPKDNASSIGKNISDVLGGAFFGNADDAYAQVYLNGYDNVSQNEANIMREATTSITIVAQSKSTGKKATAVFKLNNKTLPKAATGSKLNNYVDNSLYALEKDNGGKDIAGLNLTTATKSEIDSIKFSKQSTFWADGNGDGTIVIPRGTTAKQVADMIAKKKLDGTNSYRETAPMKAVQGGDHAYNHLYEPDKNSVASPGGAGTANTVSIPTDGKFNFAKKITYGMNGPSASSESNPQYREYNNVFNATSGFTGPTNSSSDPIITDTNGSKDAWFGGSAEANNASGHMLDTNKMFDGTFSNSSATTVPNASSSEANPFVNDPNALKPETYMNSKSSTGVQNVAGVKDPKSLSNVGKVGHLFQPASYVKEAYDANHFVNDNPQFKDSDSSKIAQSIANNGSFASTDPNAGIKKSFTYEAPVNTWMYKSYNNPYSTVVSSQGAEKPYSGATTETTIKPQEAVDLADPNNDKPNLDADTTVKLPAAGTAKVIQTGEHTYYYVGLLDGSGHLDAEAGTTTLKIGSSASDGVLQKFGVVGTDGSNLGGVNAAAAESPRAALTPGLGGNVYRKPNFSADKSSTDNLSFGTGPIADPTDAKLAAALKANKVSKGNSQFFVQTWDKNVVSASGSTPLIYNVNAIRTPATTLTADTLDKVDGPNFESKYYVEGVIDLEAPDIRYSINEHIVQSSDSKKASFNSNLYNNPNSEFSKDADTKHKNNSRFFVSQDFSVGPVSSDMVSKTGDSTVDSDPNKILDTVAKNSDPTKANDLTGAPNGKDAKAEFTAEKGYKLVTLDDAAKNQGTTVDALANEVAKVTGKSVDTVKNTKWLEASLPRVKENAGTARINVVVYDKEAVPAPTKQDTKPSFSTTDVSGGNDPFNVNLRPYTTTYDDGAVLTTANVPQNFKNLLTKTLVAGNPDLVDATGKVSTNKLQQILVSSFLGSWQQNDGSFKQTDSGAGVSSPLYMYGGFGISNSDTKNSYSQWPLGYTDNSGDYNNAVSNFSGDFYRGAADLKTADGKSTIKGVPFTAVTADVSKLDVTKAGTYPVVYTYTNPDNAKDTASITVPVTVSDASAPVFAFQGSTDSTINVGDSFNEHEYKVVGSWSIFNNYGGDYSKLPNCEGIAKNGDGTPQVTITGHVDTHTPGIYQLTYKATSISGASTTMIRNITVLPKEATTDWTITDMKAVGYINYVPGYGIMVYNAPAGGATGQRLAHATAWKISQKAVNTKGDVFYRVGNAQWINGKYVSFSPISTMTPLRGEVQIVYKKGYGVNLWKSAGTTNGYYAGRKLMHGSKWKTSGKQNGFYKVGNDQWIQGDYASYKAY